MNTNHVCSLVFVFLGVLGAAIIVHKVEAPPPPTFIYIRADGSIDPPAQPYIESINNITYTFKADMYASIVVERSNIIIDGKWHTLEGDHLPIPGLNLTSVSNVTINNANIDRFDTGIYLESASQCIISGNNLTLSNAGIRLYSSSGNTISGNNVTENDFAGIVLISSSLNNVSQNMITSNIFGIRLEEQSHSNTISQNEIADNGNGIDLYSLDFFQESNMILGNDIKNNEWGLHFLVTSNCTITRNKIENNTEGVVIYRSRYTTITENNITNNTNHGIYLDFSTDGKVYHNNFIDNDMPLLYSSSTTWNSGIPSSGNYWSDYSGTDVNRDGIGDEPFLVGTYDQDNYPLMGLFSSFSTSAGKYVTIISNSTIGGFNYFESNNTITMHVSNTTVNQTHGFVRMSIPYEVMAEPFKVTIDGANPTYWNYTLYDNGTHKWIYFEYEHSTRKIVIVPESSSFLILPLFMITTPLVIVLCKKKTSWSYGIESIAT